MASYLSFVVFLFSIGSLNAILKEPDVQVYSRLPVEAGQKNTLNCYVEGFHPPKIDITLLKDNVPMEDVKKSDLSFSTDWTYQLLVSKEITPDGRSEYSCRVDHESLKGPKIVKWDQE